MSAHPGLRSPPPYACASFLPHGVVQVVLTLLLFLVITLRSRAIYTPPSRHLKSEGVFQVGTHRVRFNPGATRWLGIWLDATFNLVENRRRRIGRTRQAEARLRRIVSRYGVPPAAARNLQATIVQGSCCAHRGSHGMEEGMSRRSTNWRLIAWAMPPWASSIHTAWHRRGMRLEHPIWRVDRAPPCHLGTNKEVFDVEAFAIYHAIHALGQRQEKEHRYTVFLDSASAIVRAGNDALGPGQRFAVAAIEVCS